MRTSRHNLTDYKRVDKINIGHNLTEAFDMHDTVKLLLCRMLRRKHPDKGKCPIYTEHDPENPNKDYPDIWMNLNGDIYVWEIQKAITDNWKDKIMEQYSDVNLIIVNISKFNEDMEISLIKEMLQEYLI